MVVIFELQNWLFRALLLALVAAEVWALINALRFRPGAYTAASKRTKTFWSLMAAGSVLLGLLALWGLSPYLLGIIGIVMAGVFLADVLPALRLVMLRAQGNSR